MSLRFPGIGDRNPSNDREEKRSRKLRAILRFSCVILAFVAIGIVATVWDSAAAIGVAIIIVLASGVVGSLLGFLFAIPRVLTKDDPQVEVKTSEPKNAAGNAELKRPLLASNTNLERVSDWLTTMLVGVGLSQLTSVNAGLTQFRVFLQSAQYCGQQSCGATLLPIIGPFLLVLGAVVGFLLCYVYTRIGLSELFHDLERDLVEPEPIRADKPEEVSVATAAVTDAAASLRKESGNPAYQNLIPGTQPSVEDSLNVMGILLYRENGYQQVIDLAGKLSSTSINKRAEYWFYLAAAFGQKYSMSLKAGAADSSSRDNALDCARRAVVIDPMYRSRLWDISSPDNIDNDLADLREEEDFRKIVGKYR